MAREIIVALLDEDAGVFRLRGGGPVMPWHRCGECGRIWISDVSWAVCPWCETELSDDLLVVNVEIYTVEGAVLSWEPTDGEQEPPASDQ